MGQSPQYPYIINDSMRIAKTHMQYYQLALEQDKDSDGENDIVVWYCLGSRKAENEIRRLITMRIVIMMSVIITIFTVKEM